MATNPTHVEEYKVSIRIQRDGYDREVLIPRSQYIVESLDTDNLGNVEEYTLKVTPEYFSYIKSSSNTMLVLDRTKVTEEEAEKIKKEIGMNTDEKGCCTCGACKIETACGATLYLPRERGIKAFHVTRENLSDIASFMDGIVDYSDYPYVLKFKASGKSTRKDRQATYGTTIYWNGDDERWEVMTTVEFLNRYRVAGEDEASY